MCHRVRKWHIAMRAGERFSLLGKGEKPKADVQAEVERPLRIIKRQSGFVSVRHCGLKKSVAPLLVLFALSNLWMLRSYALGARA